MPTIKLTRRNISALPAPAKATIFYDSELTGFGLACRPSGARSFVIEYRPGAGGRGTSKKRVVIGTPDVMAVETARKEAARELARVELGADPAAERRAERQAETVSELVEQWFSRHVAKKRKPATRRFYRYVLDKHILPRMGSRKAIAITRADVARHHSAIAEHAGQTIANRVLVTLSAAYSWTIKLGALPAGFINPCVGIERHKEAARECILSGEDLARLGEALRLAETVGLPWEVDTSKPKTKHAPKVESRRVTFPASIVGAFRLLLLTGMRLGEVLNLQWSHVDFERGVLRLPDSKTGAKTVPLGSAALTLLEGLPRLGRYVVASSSAGEKEEKPRHDLNKPWRTIRKAAGLPALRLHDLRHVFGGTGAGSGLSLHQVGALLGHSQPATTMRYANMAVDPQRRAADVVADQLAAAIGLSVGGKKRRPVEDIANELAAALGLESIDVTALAVTLGAPQADVTEIGGRRRA